MKVFYLFFAAWFCLFSNLSAQSKTFHLGLKLELYSYTYLKANSKGIYINPLPSFHIIVSKDLSKSISINFKPGLLFGPYQAFELGFSLSNKFIPTCIFISGGLNMDFVKGEGGNSGTNSKTIFFLLLGTGYQITERLSADISFHQALNGEFGYGVPKKIFNMLKIGFAASL